MTSAIITMVSSTVALGADATATRPYNLPAHDAASALKLFSEQSGRGVIAGTEMVKGVRTNPVKGELTALDALTRMLAGTGLMGVEDRKSGTFAVRKVPEVNGEGTGGAHPGGDSRESTNGRKTRTPPTQEPMKRTKLFAPLTAIFALFAGTPASAQSADSGTIVGRVYKPGTGEYVRNAEVRISGSNRSSESNESGHYRLDNVPAGEVEVVVKHMGYQPASARLSVAAGEVATRDFDLQPLGTNRADGTVQLQAFEVVAEREGNAKALQDQKRSMTISNVVGSELFGDTSEGNVGEFLKYLPGIDLDYVQNDARGPRMRGMDPRYVGLTLDGMKLASADSFMLTTGSQNGGTDDSRAFGFESISFSGIDSVEVFKTLSADLDADAPAGSINLRSKRAFDRKGRRISWQLNVSGNGEEPYWKTFGPFDGEHRKVRMGGMLEYSDQFLNNRLGIVVNINHSDSFNVARRTVMPPANRQATPDDPRPAVPQRIVLNDAPKVSIRTSETFTIDYKATPSFNIGVVTTFSQYETWIDGRQITFVTSANNTSAAGRISVQGEDPLVSLTTTSASAAQLQLQGQGLFKLTNSATVTPRFDWKPTPNFSVEGRFGISHAKNDYEGLARGVVTSRITPPTTANSGLMFRAERPDPTSPNYTITQIAGRDWGDPASFTGPNIQSTERLHINDVTSGDLSARWRLRMGPLSSLRFGLKSREEKTKFNEESSWNSWAYVGPPGTVNPSWAGYSTPNQFDMGTLNATALSLSGRPVALPGRQYAADLFKAHPEYFNHTGATPANYYTSFIGSVRDLTERVDAAFVMGHAQFGKLQIQPGVRVEETHAETTSFNQRPREEMLAQGYTLDASGRATTIEGLQYQYETLPKLVREGKYRNWFPSVNMKYTFTENLIAQLGYNKAISRPPLFNLSGPVTVNETSQEINAPNPTLLPEHSENVSARLAYYFEPVGTLSVGVFQNTVENFRGTFVYTDPESIAALGFDPDAYAGYSVKTQRNVAGTRRFRGMEVEYRQALSFLPGALRGIDVFTSFTRNYANVRRGGMAPYNISAGVSYNYKRFSANVRAIHTPDTPWTQNIEERFREARTMTDVGLSYRFNERLTFSLSGRNVFNTPYSLQEAWPEGIRLQWYEVYGAMWVFSMKGSF